MEDPISAPSAYAARVRALEAFGHRGSATTHERRAAEHLAAELEGLGLVPALEPFPATSRAGGVLLLHVALAAAGAAVQWPLPWLSAAAAALALGSLVAESLARPYALSRVLRIGESRNVVATAPARSGRAQRRIVLVAHYDTQRTGLMWSGPLVEHTSRLLARSPGVTKSPLFPVLAAMVFQAGWGVARGLGATGSSLAAAGAIPLIVYAVAGFLLADWARGRFVPGANDNATGAAAVVTLAERWLQEPVEDVEAVFVLTGCEETGLTGSAAWADRHRSENQALPTVFLNIDSLGYGRPRFVEQEVSLGGVPVNYPEAEVALAAEVAGEMGLVDAGPHRVPVPSDGLALLGRGLRGVTVNAFCDGGLMPNYHVLADTSDRMDFEVAEAGLEFCWRLMRRLAAAG